MRPHKGEPKRRKKRAHGEPEPAVQSSGVHHLDIVVSAIDRSLPFYRDLLAPLGYHGISEVEGERGETIYYLWGPGTSFGLREAQSPTATPVDRYAVGLHHVAFEAVSRAAVDARAECLLARQPDIESSPQEYAYQLGY